MPPTMSNEGIRLATELAVTSPRTRVVVLSQYDEPEYVLAVLERGAAGRAYLLKEKISNVEQLFRRSAVAAGGSLIDATVVERLVAARAWRTQLGALTARERDVLAAMARGLSNTAVADLLGIGVRVVEKHINVIFTRLGLDENDRTHRRVPDAARSGRRPPAASPGDCPRTAPDRRRGLPAS
jgi:DNA-binding NarL/FixJ family response regulator